MVAATENRRPALLGRVEAERAEIEHVLSELVRLGVKVTTMPLLPARSRRGRPKSLKTLERELRHLAQLHAWLHGQLIEARGERIFEGPFESLAAAGIVAAPSEPKKRGRGRPAKSPTADALQAWTQIIERAHRWAAKPITTREAYALAQRIVNAQMGTHSNATEANLYRARRRRRKAE